MVEGESALTGIGVLAAYTGHGVTCDPERSPDGTMSEAYCQLASTEAILDCCDLSNEPAGVCSRDNPPGDCQVQCAERWLPLVENCERFLGAFGALSAPTGAVRRPL